MRRLVLVILIYCVIAQELPASETVLDSSWECIFEIPEKWSLQKISDDEFLISSPDDSLVAISIGRYVLEDGPQIGSDDDLREALIGLYASLGIEASQEEQPDFERQPSAATFGTVWTSEIDQQEYQNRLQGTIFRRADGRQLMYLLLAKAPKKSYPTALAAFEKIALSFEITAPRHDSLYPRRTFGMYFLLLFILILSAFFFARNRRVQRSKNPLGRDSNSFWRCPDCRRVNHIDHDHCSRCGQERIITTRTEKRP
jgi:hypothetical protein